MQPKQKDFPGFNPGFNKVYMFYSEIILFIPIWGIVFRRLSSSILC